MPKIAFCLLVGFLPWRCLRTMQAFLLARAAFEYDSQVPALKGVKSTSYRRIIANTSIKLEQPSCFMPSLHRDSLPFVPDTEAECHDDCMRARVCVRVCAQFRDPTLYCRIHQSGITGLQLQLQFYPPILQFSYTLEKISYYILILYNIIIHHCRYIILFLAYLVPGYKRLLVLVAETQLL